MSCSTSRADRPSRALGVRGRDPGELADRGPVEPADGEPDPDPRELVEGFSYAEPLAGEPRRIAERSLEILEERREPELLVRASAKREQQPSRLFRVILTFGLR